MKKSKPATKKTKESPAAIKKAFEAARKDRSESGAMKAVARETGKSVSEIRDAIK